MGTASRSAAGPPTSVERLLADARAGLERLTPEQAHAAMGAGALLVDIRSDSQRASDGVIPGARVVPRNVLEWRLDPACPYRDPELGRREARIVVLCDQGYQSSLAARYRAVVRRLRCDRRDRRLPRVARSRAARRALIGDQADDERRV